tara:strand:- start:12338 stop:15352 length:3015 start_codon:yes stop_codon:yes gene_type:complete
MAKDKYTSKDQAKLNAEIQQQNKLLDSARKQVAAMGVEYDKFSDKRKKAAKDYKAQLDKAQAKLEQIAEKAIEIADNHQTIADFSRSVNVEQANLTKMMADHSKAQEKNIMGAMALQGFDKTAEKAAATKQTLAAGNLAVGQALSATLALDVGMLEEVKSANIDIGSLMESQDLIRDNMAIAHSDEIANLEASGASQTEILAKQIDQAAQVQDISDVFDTQIDQADEMNEAMSKRTIGGFETREILEKQTEEFEAQQELLNDLKDSAKKYIGIFSNGQLAFAFIANQIGKFAREMREFANSSGVSLSTSAKMVGQAKLVTAETIGLGIAQEDVAAVQASMLDKGVALKDITQENVKQASILSARFGMGADAAVGFRKQLMEMAGGSEDTATHMQNSVAALAKANGLAPGKLMSIVADNTEEFSRFGKKGFDNVAKAAVAAKKLNIEFSSLVSAGKGLLDIETSIEAEMQAGVMIGRELNLNAAREAALRGDHLEVAKQLTAQMGSLEEFQDLNVLQQQSLADAMNMTVEEITNAMENQGKLNDLSEAGLEHYKETGEIGEQQEGWLSRAGMLLATNAESAAAIASSFGGWKNMLEGAGGILKGIGGKLKGMVGMGGDKAPSTSSLGGDSPIPTKPEAPKLPDTKGAGPGSQGGVMDGIGKIDMNKVLKGAAAMVIVAAAVFVFAKAVQEFMGVSWSAVGMAVVSMLALVGAVALLGMIMTSGVGAVAIIAGAAAMLIVAAAMLVLAVALKIMSQAIPNFMLLIPVLPELAIGMFMLAPALPIMFLLGLALPALGFGLAAASIGFAIFNAVGGTETLMGLSVALAPLAMIGPGLLQAGVGIAAMGVGMIPLAFGMMLLGPMVPMFMLFATAITMMIEPLTALAGLLEPLAGLGMVLAELGLGFAAMGIGFIPLALGLALITPLLPTLFALEKLGLLSGIGTAEKDLEDSKNDDKDSSSSDGGGSNAELMAKMDELITAVKSGGTINLDGRKVGEVLNLGKGPVGA